MPRKPLEIETYGSIKTTRQPSGKWRASARFRDLDGQTRTVQAFGVSSNEAERRLKRAVQERVSSTGEDITRDMKLEALGEMWLDELIVDGKVTAQTVGQYRFDVEKTIKPALGGLRVFECTTSRMDRFLKEQSKGTPAKAKRLKVILSGMLGMAVRHDAMASNPIREVAGIASSHKEVRAITLDELKALRERVRLWESGAPMDGESGRHVGRPRAKGILDAMNVMLATGTRVGELLAIRWCDIDLSATPPRLTITGTIVRLPGEGLRRQTRTKTASGHRTVLLPCFAVETLMRLQLEALPNPYDVVFPSSSGTLRDPHNFRRQLRDARGDQFAWVTPHSFRRTVATLIDRETSTEQAAAQLGHSGTAVTTRHYIEKAAEAPDLTQVLDRLGG
ncbi:tyrosine-type recombinase/integrase [Speluncibacter jeojiensis]|uniref:Site-specific integrase n=1 Tax=Speluncibacter jeojiensis TaxID=2710754 RepID=A0A9X4RCS0_9ACTN|nr:site-specific integrase [Corynebacteriales bacterium D3-21]